MEFVAPRQQQSARHARADPLKNRLLEPQAGRATHGVPIPQRQDLAKRARGCERRSEAGKLESFLIMMVVCSSPLIMIIRMTIVIVFLYFKQKSEAYRSLHKFTGTSPPTSFKDLLKIDATKVVHCTEPFVRATTFSLTWIGRRITAREPFSRHAQLLRPSLHQPVYVEVAIVSCKGCCFLTVTGPEALSVPSACRDMGSKGRKCGGGSNQRPLLRRALRALRTILAAEWLALIG